MTDETTTTPAETDVSDTPSQTPDIGATDTSEESGSGTSEQDTFPRAYVEELRQENGKYRQDARDAAARSQQLAERLHAALVAADGRLHDPTDLAFDEAHLADDGAPLAQAIEDLLARKPHLAIRKVAGDIGQGARNGAEPVSLLGMLRGTN